MSSQEYSSNMEKELSSWPVISLIFAMIILYGVGLYAIVSVLLQNPLAVAIVLQFLGAMWTTIVSYSKLIAALILSLILITIGLMIFILKLIAKIGKEVTTVLFYSGPVVLLFIGALSFLIGVFILVIVFVALGALFLFLVFRWKDRIRLAGSLIELSAKAVSDEPEVIGVSMIFSIFAFISAIVGIAGTIWIYYVSSSYFDSETIGGILAFLYDLVYAWVVYAAMYFSNGIIVAIVDDWYRSPSKDQAWLAKGTKRVLGFVNPIVKLGFVMALLDTVARYARNIRMEQAKKNPVLIVALIFFKIASALAYGLAQFVTFFALPAMIIEGKGFKDSIKRSWDLIKKHFIDIIIYASGVGVVYMFFIFIMILLYGVSGYLVGMFILVPILGISEDLMVVAGILTAIGFLIFGFIPAYVMVRPLQVAYKTLLYEYALDREHGFALPSRIPEEVKEEFEAIIAKPPLVKTMFRQNNP
ncbi:MAG: glycerophosphoryl diester phosphodiesterase membrane domain-containing protein [Candidatus Odinarchaeota archaeon]|nr:glycerophosphoryl diester phosphodiesterase membrane domain-containing protein [Candidatus Odinarchaeota archaeon]